MPAVLLTLEVSNPDRSNDVKLLQPLNIFTILVTLSVTSKYSTVNKLLLSRKLHLLKSFSLVISTVYTPLLSTSFTSYTYPSLKAGTTPLALAV